MFLPSVCLIVIASVFTPVIESSANLDKMDEPKYLKNFRSRFASQIVPVEQTEVQKRYPFDVGRYLRKLESEKTVRQAIEMKMRQLARMRNSAAAR